MKIALTDKDGMIHVYTEFENMDNGLIGQTITELEILKHQLLELYTTYEEDGI